MTALRAHARRRPALALAGALAAAAIASQVARAGAERAPDEVLELGVAGGDGVVVEVYRDPAGERGVLAVRAGERRRPSRVYPMWKVAAGDIAGDGRDRVVLGVLTRQPRHGEPLPRRTVWVLAVDRGRLVEEWRGSALARPLRDFALADVSGDRSAELLALEDAGAAGGAPRCAITAYRWNGFGFAGVASTPAPCDAELDPDRPRCLASPAGKRCASLSGRTLVLK